jgi:hypothetical protein
MPSPPDNKQLLQTCCCQTASLILSLLLLLLLPTWEPVSCSLRHQAWRWSCATARVWFIAVQALSLELLHSPCLNSRWLLPLPVQPDCSC